MEPIKSILFLSCFLLFMWDVLSQDSLYYISAPVWCISELGWHKPTVASFVKPAKNCLMQHKQHLLTIQFHKGAAAELR